MGFPVFEFGHFIAVGDLSVVLAVVDCGVGAAGEVAAEVERGTARALLLGVDEQLQLLLEHIVLPPQLLDELGLAAGAGRQLGAGVVGERGWKLLKHEILYINRVYRQCGSLLLAFRLLELLLRLLALALLDGLLHRFHLLAVLFLLFLAFLVVLPLAVLVVLLLAEVEVDGVGVILVELAAVVVGFLNCGLGVEEDGEDGGLFPVLLVLDVLFDVAGGFVGGGVVVGVHLQLEVGEVLGGCLELHQDADVVGLGLDQLAGELLELAEALNVHVVADQSLLVEHLGPEVGDRDRLHLVWVSAAGQPLRSVELRIHLVPKGYVRDKLVDGLLQQFVFFADGLELLCHGCAECGLLLLERVDGVPAQLLVFGAFRSLFLDGGQQFLIALVLIELVLGVALEDGVLVLFVVVLVLLLLLGVL